MPNKKVIEDGCSVKEAAFLVEVNYQTTAYVIKIFKNTLRLFQRTQTKLKNEFWLF